MSPGIKPILDAAGFAIYAALALVAIFGAFYVILLLRRIAQKRFFTEAAANQFLEDVRERMAQKRFDQVAELCDSPAYWSKAVPQLMLVALDNRQLPPTKLRRMLGERFEREILAGLEHGTSWISTTVKSAPMLGLLGTVVGMIGAFAKIAEAANPSALAGEISLALWTTAIGLMIAIPLVLAGNAIHVRIGKLQDAVQDHLGVFLDDLDAVMASERGRAA